jgi:excisionase family DNA binding protein
MPGPDLEEEVLTVTEIAVRYKVSVREVRRWTGSGELPFYKLGKLVRVRKADLDAFLRGRRKGKKKEDNE